MQERDTVFKSKFFLSKEERAKRRLFDELRRNSRVSASQFYFDEFRKELESKSTSYDQLFGILELLIEIQKNVEIPVLENHNKGIFVPFSTSDLPFDNFDGLEHIRKARLEGLVLSTKNLFVIPRVDKVPEDVLVGEVLYYGTKAEIDRQWSAYIIAQGRLPFVGERSDFWKRSSKKTPVYVRISD